MDTYFRTSKTDKFNEGRAIGFARRDLARDVKCAVQKIRSQMIPGLVTSFNLNMRRKRVSIDRSDSYKDEYGRPYCSLKCQWIELY